MFDTLGTVLEGFFFHFVATFNSVNDSKRFLNHSSVSANSKYLDDNCRHNNISPCRGYKRLSSCVRIKDRQQKIKCFNLAHFDLFLSWVLLVLPNQSRGILSSEFICGKKKEVQNHWKYWMFVQARGWWRRQQETMN